MRRTTARARAIPIVLLAVALNAVLASCSSNSDGMLSDDQKIEQAHKAHDSYMQGMSGGKGPGAPGASAGVPGTTQPGAAK